MGKLKLIFSAATPGNLAVSRFLNLRKDSLGNQGWLPQGLINQRQRTLVLKKFIFHLNRLGRQGLTGEGKISLERAQAWLDRFAKEVGEEKGRILLFQELTSAALPWLAKLLAAHPFFSSLDLQALALFDDPLLSLRWKLIANWKTDKMFSREDAILAPGSIFWHERFLRILTEHFPQSSSSWLPGPMDKAGWRQFCAWLECAPESDPRELTLMPRSFAALDMLVAVRSFPFGPLDRDEYDILKFNSLLREVEEEKGFELFGHFPAGAARRIETALPANGDPLFAVPGAKKLLAERKKLASLPDLPDPLPSISAAQCAAFIEAMPPLTRTALLRHFRLKGTELNTEELALAKGLEGYRSSHFPQSTFRWPRPEPVLSVLTTTKNHKDYILQCMESVSAQRVDFPLEHIIVDNCSDDGTQDIIENYASRHSHVRPIYLGKKNRKNFIYTVFDACRSEFTALCDGDDYFTDPDKLSIQLNFLKDNGDFTVCFHPVLVVFEDPQRSSFIYPTKDVVPGGFRSTYSLDDLIRGNFIQTNSAMYRWRFRDGLPDWFRADLRPGDWYWHLLHAEKGKIGFMRRVMSAYRRHPKSLYATSFQVSSTEHRKKHGLKELQALDVINTHFNNRFLPVLTDMASGVLSDFVKIQMEEDDSSLLDLAAKQYPVFTYQFLKHLSSLKG